MEKVNGKKVEDIPGAEMMNEKIHDSNPGIPTVTKVQVGSHCTLALPVKLAHQATRDGVCDFCKAPVDPKADLEECLERPPIVGHFHKIYKLASIQDGGDRLILTRVK